MNRIKITIIDDDKLVGNLLKDYLNSIDNFQVHNVYFGGNSFLASLTRQNTPDIIVLDLRMKEGSGNEVIQAVRKDYPKIKIIVLSTYYDPCYLGFMLRSGVHAFIPKEIDKSELVNVIQETYIKGHYFNEEQLNVLREQIATGVPTLKTDNQDQLTKRELEVLELICHQMTTKHIANELFISKKTVDTYRAKLLLKTGAQNSVGLIIYAIQNNLVDPKQIPII